MPRATRRSARRQCWLRTTSKALDSLGRRLQKAAPPGSFTAMLMRRTYLRPCTTAAAVLLVATTLSAQAPGTLQVTAIRAGRLLDPEAGRILTNQIILV